MWLICKEDRVSVWFVVVLLVSQRDDTCKAAEKKMMLSTETGRIKNFW